MNILLVEDDQIKHNKIVDFLNSIDNFDVTLDHAESFNSGSKKAISGDFDLVLLDMSIPSFDMRNGVSGGTPQAFGGRKILRQMVRRHIITPVVVVTQFESFGEGSAQIDLTELNRLLQDDYSEIYKGLVFYNSSEDNWKIDLIKYVKEIAG